MATESLDLELLGAAVRRHRHAAGLTLRQLAIAVDIDQNGIWRIEKAKHTPSSATLFRIARALNVSLDDLTEASHEEAT